MRRAVPPTTLGAGVPWAGRKLPPSRVGWRPVPGRTIRGDKPRMRPADYGRRVRIERQAGIGREHVAMTIAEEGVSSEEDPIADQRDAARRMSRDVQDSQAVDLVALLRPSVCRSGCRCVSTRTRTSSGRRPKLSHRSKHPRRVSLDPTIHNHQPVVDLHHVGVTDRVSSTLWIPSATCNVITSPAPTARHGTPAVGRGQTADPAKILRSTPGGRQRRAHA